MSWWSAEQGEVCSSAGATGDRQWHTAQRNGGWDRPTNRATDRPTNRPTNHITNRATSRVANSATNIDPPAVPPPPDPKKQGRGSRPQTQPVAFNSLQEEGCQHPRPSPGPKLQPAVLDAGEVELHAAVRPATAARRRWQWQQPDDPRRFRRRRLSARCDNGWSERGYYSNAMSQSFFLKLTKFQQASSVPPAVPRPCVPPPRDVLFLLRNPSPTPPTSASPPPPQTATG